MSTPERADDPGEHGYGGAKQDFPEEDMPRGPDGEEEERGHDRRHVNGGARGEGDGVDYPSE